MTQSLAAAALDGAMHVALLNAPSPACEPDRLQLGREAGPYRPVQRYGAFRTGNAESVASGSHVTQKLVSQIAQLLPEADASAHLQALGVLAIVLAGLQITAIVLRPKPVSLSLSDCKSQVIT